jgi:O-antigen/teichoic acid export membrane protein
MTAEELTLGEGVDAVVLPPDPRPLARQTFAYGLSGLLVPLVGIVTLPIFARVFSRSQYGVIELGTTTSTVLLTITDAGLTAAALRSFYDYGPDREPERRSVMLTGFLATSALALVVAGALIALRTEVAQWLFGESGQSTIFIAIACSIVALNTWRYSGEVMRVRFQAFDYLAMSTLAAVVTTALGVTGVLAFGWRVNGVFFAAVVGNSLAAGFGLLRVKRWLQGSFSGWELRRMLAYGLPLVPSSLSAWALALADRIILARLGSLSQVGEYAVANRLALMLVIGMTAFLFALTPFLLSTYSQDPEQEKAARGRTLTYLTFILAFAGLGLTLFAKEVFEVVAPKFGDAYLAVGPLTLGTVAYGIAALLTTGLAIVRKTLHLAALAIVAAALNIGLNLVLIPPLGIVGSALATTVGYGALAGMYYWVTQRLYPTPYEPRKVLTMLALGSALGVIGVVPITPLAAALAIKLAALATFVGLSWATGAMAGAEFHELRKFALGMLRRPSSA